MGKKPDFKDRIRAEAEHARHKERLSQDKEDAHNNSWPATDKLGNALKREPYKPDDE